MFYFLSTATINTFMAVNGKQKGNSFERSVADFLTKLYGEKFLRVPSSGAFIGGKNIVRKDVLSESQIRNFKGDIIPGESFPRLNLECKSYADFPFHQLFSGKVKILDTWISQCVSVEDQGDLSMLVMKFNRKGQYVAVRAEMVGLQCKNHLVYDSPTLGSWVIMEHGQFWELNADAVKNLCGKVIPDIYIRRKTRTEE